MTIKELRKLWIYLPQKTGVYMIRSPSKEYYYGYSRNIRRRVYQHCMNSVKNCHHNLCLQNAILKHGAKCKVEVVQTCETAQQAIELEGQYINMFYDDPNNLNISRVFSKQAGALPVKTKLQYKGKDVPALVIYLRSQVYGANIETTWRFFDLGISTPSELKSLIANCTDIVNLSCRMRFYVLGRWFTGYESCQDNTGFSYSYINKIMQYAED